MRPSISLFNFAEIARSPRARNHARSILELGWRLNLYTTDTTAVQLGDILTIPLAFTRTGGKADTIRGIRKFRMWTAGLTRALKSGYPCDGVLLMTPPALPAFPILRRWQRHSGKSLIIDWHNTGASRMRLRFGPNHPLTWLYKKIECQPWHEATHHIAVSRALADFLRDGPCRRCGVEVLYDGPAGECPVRPDRPVFLEAQGLNRRGLHSAYWVVCPTGWNEEERPEWVVESLDHIAAEANASGLNRDILIFLTGDAPPPMRNSHHRSVDGRLNLVCRWFDHESYAALLRMADGGLCTHVSTSGLDLPMKLSDMLRVGLRCLVYRYAAVLDEVFHPPGDGLFFSSKESLASDLIRMLMHPPTKEVQWRAPEWEDRWPRIFRPIFRS